MSPVPTQPANAIARTLGARPRLGARVTCPWLMKLARVLRRPPPPYQSVGLWLVPLPPLAPPHVAFALRLVPMTRGRLLQADVLGARKRQRRVGSVEQVIDGDGPAGTLGLGFARRVPSAHKRRLAL